MTFTSALKFYQITGQRTLLHIPVRHERLIAFYKDSVRLEQWQNGKWTLLPSEVSNDTVSNDTRNLETMQIAVSSSVPGRHPLHLHLFSPDAEDNTSEDILVELFTFQVALDVDANRDGKIDPGHPCKGRWEWGNCRCGAIVMVNSLGIRRDFALNPPLQKLQESLLAPLRVQPLNVAAPPDEIELVLYATPNAARRFRVLRRADDGSFERVLGGDMADPNAVACSISKPLAHTGEDLYVEALHYPGTQLDKKEGAVSYTGSSFEGLITIELLLRLKSREIAADSGTPTGAETSREHVDVIGMDRVVLRVAPWIATPCTQPATTVYMALQSEKFLPEGGSDRKALLQAIEEVCKQKQVEFHPISADDAGSYLFVQDEVEFGYSHGPGTALDGEEIKLDVACGNHPPMFLQGLEVLGPNLGIVQIDGSFSGNLDSFGNVEVSPPVIVRGKNYPFGRILFGGRTYGDFEDAREARTDIRKFLYAQKVQEPFEIYTDWLTVGHVDEVINFVSWDSEKGFRVLLASPALAFALLQQVQDRGYGDQSFLYHKQRTCEGEPPSFISAQITVNELLNDAPLQQRNARFQRHMDLNRQILIEELELGKNDLIDIPCLFLGRDPCLKAGSPEVSLRTSAFFPNLLNHLVLGNISIVPKPFGPELDGRDVFERYLEESLPGRQIVWVPDWYSYYVQAGDIHCATNVKRQPFEKKWWEFRPVEGFDV